MRARVVAVSIAVPLAVALAAAAGGCVEATPLIESTTALRPTADTVGPYQVQTVVTGVTDQVVELRYRLAGQVRFIPLVMSPDHGGERFRAAIPGSPAGTSISYYVTVLQDGEPVATDPEAAGAEPYTFRILSP